MSEDVISPLLNKMEEGPLMVALVGAGGKTTTMLTLAKAFAAMKKRVLISTTTKIYEPREVFINGVLLGDQVLESERSVEPGTAWVLAQSREENGKLKGVPSDVLDRLHEESLFDIILVEADGAGGRPIKAPAAHEPVIPEACTHVVGIIGMDALGQPMNSSHVHRLEHFLSLTGCKEGDIIDKEALILLIGSPLGLFKNTPLKAQRVLLLNKCTDDRLRDIAGAVISECMDSHVGGVSLGVRC